MQHILSYPRYFPGNKDFRAYLLLYDRVSTIVPATDQARVRARREIEEVADAIHGEPISFFDPTDYYGTWDTQTTLANNFARMRDEVIKGETVDLARSVRTHRAKNKQPIDKEDLLYKRLRRAKWRYLSISKMPKSYSELLLDKGLAICVAETALTESPLLVHPRLADYLMSRLTRQIATREDVAPVAAFTKDVGDVLIDGRLDERRQRAQLLAFTLDIAVPHEITEVPADEFRSIRESLAPTRERLSEVLQQSLTRLNIDSDRDARVFRERLEAHRSDLETRIETARRRIPWRRRATVAVDIVMAAAGVAVGHVAGGLPGEIVGATVATVVSRKLSQLSTRLYPEDMEHVQQMAVLKNRILDIERRPARIPVNYYI